MLREPKRVWTPLINPFNNSKAQCLLQTFDKATPDTAILFC